MNMPELNDSDAHIRETRFSEISVEGYDDTSLQKYAIKLKLMKHFASCGNILDISVIKSVALMRLEGEDAEEKALALSGTDVGGWIPIVKSAPWKREPYCAARIQAWRMFVTGYDIGLPKIDIQTALYKHFSSCGEVTDVIVLPSRAFITIEGERCEEKALELISGRDVGGMSLEVEPVMRPPEIPGDEEEDGDGEEEEGDGQGEEEDGQGEEEDGDGEMLNMLIIHMISSSGC